MNLRIWLLPISVALLGCSAQVDSAYRGEPLASLGGVVSSSSALTSSSDMNAAIVWLSFDEREDGAEPKYIGERVSVDGRFPAGFSLKLFTPPPPEAEISTTVDYCVAKDSVGPSSDCEKGRLIPRGTGNGTWAGVFTAVKAG